MDCQSRLKQSRDVKVQANFIAQNIASVVRARRAELGISQEALADSADIDRTYASQIERAIANPSLSVLCSVANALGLKLRDLIGSN